jgi:hypothetical protein
MYMRLCSAPSSRGARDVLIGPSDSDVHAGEEAPYPDSTFDLNELLPEDTSYMAYIGSLVRNSLLLYGTLLQA